MTLFISSVVAPFLLVLFCGGRLVLSKIGRMIYFSLAPSVAMPGGVVEPDAEPGEEVDGGNASSS